MTPFIFLPLLTLFPIIALLIQRKHLLIILLSLEGIILSLTIVVRTTVNNLNILNLFTVLFILALGACEAALGLSLLVAISRSYGTDIVRTLSINKC